MSRSGRGRGDAGTCGQSPSGSNTVGIAGYPGTAAARTAAARPVPPRAWPAPRAPARGLRPRRRGPAAPAGPRSRGPRSGGDRLIRSASAIPSLSRCRIAHLRPPRPGLPTDRLATGWSAPSSAALATSLYTSAAVGAPDPVTSDVPTPYPSTGAAPSAAIEYSSRSPVTMIRVPVAPSSSSRARTCRATTGRSPLSIRTAPSSLPAAATAVRTARGTS